MTTKDWFDPKHKSEVFQAVCEAFYKQVVPKVTLLNVNFLEPNPGSNRFQIYPLLDNPVKGETLGYLTIDPKSGELHWGGRSFIIQVTPDASYSFELIPIPA